MILGTKARYAVMAVVELAGRTDGCPVSLSELAKEQEITVPYLEQLFSKLRVAGIVRSVRGPGGGYILNKNAKDICISEIVEAVDESLKMTRCGAEEKSGCMASKTRCLTHNLWAGLEKKIHGYLQDITLADVLKR